MAMRRTYPLWAYLLALSVALFLSGRAIAWWSARGMQGDPRAEIAPPRTWTTSDRVASQGGIDQPEGLHPLERKPSERRGREGGVIGRVFGEDEGEVEGASEETDAEGATQEGEEVAPMRGVVAETPSPVPLGGEREPAEVEALRELSSPPGRGGERELRFGARVASPTIPVPFRATPTPTPVATTEWWEGQARGFALLAALHPRARAMVESEVGTLLESKLRNLALGILVDGTFGSDLGYVGDLINRLTVEERTLTLVLYLTNGPTMRRFETTPIHTAFSLIPPEIFRELIQSEQEVQRRYREIVAATRGLFELNRARSGAGHNIAVVMLEDNLDATSYGVMRAMASELYDGNVEFVRNPCVGCYPGNDDTSLGDGIELHVLDEIEQLGARDGFSFDGIGFTYPDEGETPGVPTFASLTDLLMGDAARSLRYVMLWRPELQGLGDQSIHPDDRVYEVPKSHHRDFDIELLRAGLTREVPDA